MMLALLLQNMDLVDCRSLQNYGVVFFLQIEVQVQYVVACAVEMWHSDILMTRSFPIGTCMNVTMQPLQFSSSIFALPFFLMVMKHVKLLFVDYTDFLGYFTSDV